MSTPSDPHALDQALQAAIERAWRGQVNEAQQDLVQALADHAGQLTLLQAALSDAMTGGVCMFGGRYEEGLKLALPALQLIEQNGLGDKLDWLYAAIGYSLGNQGDPEHGLEWVGRALAITEASPTSAGRRKALNTQGTLLALMHEMGPALQALRGALDIAQAQGQPRAIALCHVNIASTLIMWVRMLDPERDAAQREALALEALDAAETAINIDAEDGPAQTSLAARIYRGEALTLLGRHREACDALTSLLPRVQGNKHRHVELLHALARAELAAANHASARTHLREAERMARAHNLEALLLDILPTGVEIEQRMGDVQAALACSQAHALFLKQHYQHRIRAVTRMAELFAEAQQLRRQSESLRRESLAWEDAALRDALTGTFNRRGLSRHGELARRGAARMGVAALDADHFKLVNDQFGHALGDAVLCQIAELVGTHSRAGDLLARIGGEEFILLLPGADAENARLSCERVRRAIEQFPWASLAPGLAVTVSIGLAFDATGATLDAMISRADEALYRAKREGRNRVCVS